jgi:hypothetical protein
LIPNINDKNLEVVVEVDVLVEVMLGVVDATKANKLHLQRICFPATLTGHARVETKLTAA